MKMSEWLTWKRAVAAALILGALVGTHGLAYWLGARRQFNKTAGFVQSFYKECEQENLRVRVQALRIITKHAQQIPTEEVSPFYKMTDLIAESVEQSTVLPARQAENDPVADRWQREVEEARRLTALLKKREKR